MHALFDEAGKLLAGRVLADAENSAQVELESGKRLKVKAANVLLRFEKPGPAELMAAAQALAADIDLDIAWEFAPEGEFGYSELARDYFSDKSTHTELAAMLMRLHDAPHYFRRAGKGRYKKASAEVIQQALAAIEKKRVLALQITEWAGELAAGRCPQPIADQLYKILFKPDKNAPEYKAVVEATRSTQLPPLTLLQRAGAIRSAYEFHWRRFLFEHFPRGTGFGAVSAPAIRDDLPLADVQAYSIDDSSTTEIDDALSVQGLGSGTVVLGIHIAAPGLAFGPGDALDQLARARLSTVYMPGHKITMLPDEVVQQYTLAEGRACPAVSLYVTFDEATLAVQRHDTRLERVPIAANLRHDQLDGIVTESWLNSAQADAATADPADPAESGSAAGALSQNGTLPPSINKSLLLFLYRLAGHLKAQRERVRGKPETFNRPDYTFRLLRDGAVIDGEPQGDEQVAIGVRQRGAPLDLMVAEAMILANSTWGNWLAELGVPAIYRSQASLAPGIKVRMGTRALPHAGIGVSSYAWSTSPLRRYVDLVNQWQIIACARHGKTAALAAPFKPKDVSLLAAISAFDAAYSAYNAYQSGIERFWTLQYVQQQGIEEITASLIKDGLVRADHLPLVLPVMGADGLPRGARLRVRLGEVDLIALDVRGTVVERLGDDAPQDALADELADEDDDSAGPLTLAVEVSVDEPAGDARDGDASAPADAQSSAPAEPRGSAAG